MGEVQGDSTRKIYGIITVTDDQIGISNYSTGAFYNSGFNYPMNWDPYSNSWPHGYAISMDSSRIVPTANENRPVNIALLPCIKY